MGRNVDHSAKAARPFGIFGRLKLSLLSWLEHGKIRSSLEKRHFRQAWTDERVTFATSIADLTGIYSLAGHKENLNL